MGSRFEPGRGERRHARCVERHRTRTVAPSLKVTVPVGVVTAGATGLTVAVNVTGWRRLTGFEDDVTLVVLARS